LSKKKLTEKQKLFCKYYLISLNATDAAIKAGYSKKTARQIGTENLAKPYIEEYIQEQLVKRNEKLDFEAVDVVNEIKKIASSNATDFIEIIDGRIRVKSLESIDTTFISGAKEIFDKEGNFLGLEVKFHDKQKSLDMLMRHFSQYKDKVELSIDEQLQDWMRGK